MRCVSAFARVVPRQTAVDEPSVLAVALEQPEPGAAADDVPGRAARVARVDPRAPLVMPGLSLHMAQDMVDRRSLSSVTETCPSGH
jgi:hypothetical protein